MSEVVAEVTYRGNPFATYSGDGAEDRAWEYVMRKELNHDPDAHLYDVSVHEVTYGE